jgi:hypothetical protein
MRYVMRDNESGDRSGAVRQGTADRYYLRLDRECCRVVDG